MDVAVLFSVHQGRWCQFTGVRHFAGELRADHANVDPTIHRSVGGLRVVGLVVARYFIRPCCFLYLHLVPRGSWEGFQVRYIGALRYVYGANVCRVSVGVVSFFQLSYHCFPTGREECRGGLVFVVPFRFPRE